MHNDRLPMDVLEDVFLFYQVYEDVFHPLETLLLVCKFWNMAALSCRALWSRFKVGISHKPIIKMWDARLPLRLARTGSSTLLDIRIHVETGPLRMPMSDHRRKMFVPLCLENFNYRTCGCFGSREKSVASFLELLAGNRGELCKRWRTLELKLESMNFCMDPRQTGQGETLLRGLTYPTPALKTIKLWTVNIRDPVSKPPYLRVLPFTPSVKVLDIYHCFFPWQLSIPNVRKVTICQGTARLYTYPNIRSLEGSKLIEYLHLTIGPHSSVCLPSELPHLTRLMLNDAYLPLGLNECQMLRLETLIIDVGHLEISRQLVVECPDFPFGQIKRLDFRLRGNAYWSYSLEELRDSMLKILRGASASLVSLYSIGIIHSIVLKWLWEYKRSLKDEEAPGGGGKGLYFHQKVVLSTPTSSRELNGHESCEELELLANGWHIFPPTFSWKYLLCELAKESSNSAS